MTVDKQEQKKAPTITELIDGDEGLKSKRKLLTITSLILLALTFSGAKVEEANTFILKLKFENQNGIAILLVLAILFLLIRYYNYAKPYHEKLFREWSDRMLFEKFFSYSDYETGELYGLVIDVAPKSLNVDSIPYEGGEFNHFYRRLVFSRKIVYTWKGHNDYEREESGIGLENYRRVYWLEMKYQLSSFFTHRVHLDVLGPYALGVIAISSYFFHVQLNTVLSALTVSG